jgi:hypothetical protein
MTRSLRSEIFRHDNDYGFVASEVEPQRSNLSVSCVVPYYETGLLGVQTVANAAVALREYRLQSQGAGTQIVVVDDGSIARPFNAEGIEPADQLEIRAFATNRGRSAARNEGLRASASYDVCLFLDSDVLIPPDLVVRTMDVYGALHLLRKSFSAVVASLFTTIPSIEVLNDKANPVRAARVELDWRWQCVYQPDWIGAEADYCFVGQKYQLIRETSYFRSWPAMVGPWCLPNMVLGGCFAVPTALAIQLGGFEESFSQYGFTETTLVAKLVAAGTFVIPQVRCAATHVEGNPAHLSQGERNTLFRQAHQRFFREYLGITG